jgi:hypothetical protein
MSEVLMELAGLALLLVLIVGIAAWKAMRARGDDDQGDSDDPA